MFKQGLGLYVLCCGFATTLKIPCGNFHVENLLKTLIILYLMISTGTCRNYNSTAKMDFVWEVIHYFPHDSVLSILLLNIVNVEFSEPSTLWNVVESSTFQENSTLLNIPQNSTLKFPC
jgi:hypothetical protein